MTSNHDLQNALCHILGNTCRIGRTARSYEWNVTGPRALIAEACFRDQADELMTSIEGIALHIRSLGGPAIFDYSDEIVEVNPPTPKDIPSLRTMCTNLANGHLQANHSIGAAMDIAREIYEIPSIQVLGLRLERHRLHQHRLRLFASEL